MEKKDTPGVIAPPPLIYVAGLLIGLVLDRLWPLPLFAAPGRLAIGGILVLCGIVLMGLGLREFRRADTDYRPYRPSTRIITGGPFRFTRNPLYIALTAVYLGIAVAADSLWSLFLLGAVLALIHYAVVIREERYLEAKFGEEYRRYKAAVRRWL